MSSADTSAGRLYDMAYRAYGRADFATARAHADACLEIDGAFLDGWRLLAEIHAMSERPRAAIGCLRRALHLDPDDGYSLERLGRLYLDLGRAGEAARMAERAVALSPEDPSAVYLHGLALARSGAGDAATHAFERTLELRPDHPGAAFERGVLDLAAGRYARGWDGFETRHALDPDFVEPEGLPRWTGGPIDGRRLLVTSEGGFGDIIWAARFLRGVRRLGAEVSFLYPSKLSALLADLEGVDHLPGDACRLSDYDLWCPILSLPARLGVTDPGTFAPARLRPESGDPDRFEALLARAGDRLRVGIIWSGSVTYGNNRHRAARLEDFLPLVEVPDMQLFSLQKGPPQAELAERGLGDLVIDADDCDFAETAALLRELDLVIMTDSAVAHIAGSLGCPVWVLLDRNPHWYHGSSGERSPWYPSVRHFRQSRAGDWAGVMDVVVRALGAFRSRRLTGNPGGD